MQIGNYRRLGRIAPMPSLLGIAPNEPAVVVGPQDLLGFNILTASATAQVGSWYLLNLAGGPVSLTLPLLADVNPGDSVRVKTDNNAATNNGTLIAAGADQIQQGSQSGGALTLNVANDTLDVVANATLTAWEII